jgi:hypothetical protein
VPGETVRSLARTTQAAPRLRRVVTARRPRVLLLAPLGGTTWRR